MVEAHAEACRVLYDEGMAWDNPLPYLDWEFKFLAKLCRNCDEPLWNHTDNGKCLYAPTNWEP